MPYLRLESTTISDIGYVRANNQDSAFAGSRLIAIADGMGGHAGGDTASTIAIRTLAHLERAEHVPSIAASTAAMEKSILAAHDAIAGKAKKEKELSGMGTTVDAVILIRGYWILSHIGDSRAYLLRGGKLIRVSKDHSYVQHLIDTHRITPAEAKTHPQRNVVMRVLGDFDIDPHPDISVRKAEPGDRWLLCSDGLCGPLEDKTIQETLSSVIDREDCAQQIVNMALKAGSTDNVSAVIGDAVSVNERKEASILQVPLVGGAAVKSLDSIADVVQRPIASAPNLLSEQTPAQKAAQLADKGNSSTKYKASLHNKASDASVSEQIANHSLPGMENIGPDQKIAIPTHFDSDTSDNIIPETGEIPVVQKSDGTTTTDPSDPDVAQAVQSHNAEDKARKRKQKKRQLITRITVGIIGFIVIVGGATGAWLWSQTQYYLGSADGVITIYQGVPTTIFGLHLSHKVEETTIPIDSLPDTWQKRIKDGITVDSYKEAQDHASEIQKQATSLQNEKKQTATNSSSSSESQGSTNQNNSNSTNSSNSSTPSPSGDSQ